VDNPRKMHYYKLDDAIMDKAFLRGDEVVCRIAFQKHQDSPKAGDLVIVDLSTGGKYKGKIVSIVPIWIKDVAFGEMTIQRLPSL
jgi:hypothetical protein